jgi:hypothetical protein
MARAAWLRPGIGIVRRTAARPSQILPVGRPGKKEQHREITPMLSLVAHHKRPGRTAHGTR